MYYFISSRSQTFHTPYTSVQISLDRLITLSHFHRIIMRYITAVTALMIANVLAAPPAPKTLLIRDPIDTRNLPGADKFCASQRYTPNEIRAAVNFAWQAKKDGVEYRKFNPLVDMYPMASSSAPPHPNICSARN